MEQFFSDSISYIVRSKRVLYTPSAFARSSLLYLQEIGELKAHYSHESSRTGLHSFLYFTVVSGAGSLLYDGKEYKLTAGDCVFINCSRPYSHATGPEDLWSLQWIHFNSSLMEKVHEKYCKRGGQPVFRPSNSFLFASVWHDLMTTVQSDDYIRDMRVNAILGELLVLLMENSWPSNKVNDLSKNRHIVISVKKYLDQNYSDKITLDELADNFYTNKFYLAKCFKSSYGQSIHTYLLSVRITHAKKLLRFSNKSIGEIGQLCGLGAPHYFSKRFKEVEGIPPSIYREQW